MYETFFALQGADLPGFWMTTLLLYIGPDQLLPLTSLFGAIVGILLMFWNRVVGAVGWLKRTLTGQKSAADDR